MLLTAITFSILLLCVIVPPMAYKSGFGSLRTGLALVFGAVAGAAWYYFPMGFFIGDLRGYHSGDIGQTSMLFVGVPLLLSVAVAMAIAIVAGISWYNRGVSGAAVGALPRENVLAPGFWGAIGMLLFPVPVIRLVDHVLAAFPVGGRYKENSFITILALLYPFIVSVVSYFAGKWAFGRFFGGPAGRSIPATDPTFSSPARP